VGQNLPFSVDLSIGLYKIVIWHQVKEVIAKRREKLNGLIIAEAPWLLPAKNY